MHVVSWTTIANHYEESPLGIYRFDLNGIYIYMFLIYLYIHVHITFFNHLNKQNGRILPKTHPHFTRSILVVCFSNQEITTKKNVKRVPLKRCLGNSWAMKCPSPRRYIYIYIPALKCENLRIPMVPACRGHPKWWRFSKGTSPKMPQIAQIFAVFFFHPPSSWKYEKISQVWWAPSQDASLHLPRASILRGGHS